MRRRVEVSFLCGVCNKSFSSKAKCLRHEAKCDGLGNLRIKWENNLDVERNTKVIRKVRKWLKQQILHEDWQKPSDVCFDEGEYSRKRFSEEKGLQGLLKIADDQYFDHYNLRIAFSGDSIFGILIEKRSGMGGWTQEPFLILTGANKSKAIRKNVLKALYEAVVKDITKERANREPDY